MPWTETWEPPQAYMRHRGVTVYHSYKDDRADHMLEFWYQVLVDGQDDGADLYDEEALREFDVRALPEYKTMPELSHESILQRALDSGSLAELTGAMLELEQPQDWDVEVTRTCAATKTIRVKACSQQEAGDIALDYAGDYEFSEKDADYTVESTKAVAEEAPCDI